MRVVYDSDTDTLDLIFKEEPVLESDEIRQGIIIDYGRDGKIISVEVLNASEHVLDPRTMTYEVRSVTGIVKS